MNQRKWGAGSTSTKLRDELKMEDPEFSGVRTWGRVERGDIKEEGEVQGRPSEHGPAEHGSEEMLGVKF